MFSHTHTLTYSQIVIAMFFHIHSGTQFHAFYGTDRILYYTGVPTTYNRKSVSSRNQKTHRRKSQSIQKLNTVVLVERRTHTHTLLYLCFNFCFFLIVAVIERISLSPKQLLHFMLVIVFQRCFIRIVVVVVENHFCFVACVSAA